MYNRLVIKSYFLPFENVDLISIAFFDHLSTISYLDTHELLVISHPSVLVGCL